MKAVRKIILLALITAVPLLPLVLAQGIAPGQGAGNGGNAAVQSALKILSPNSGDVLHQNSVSVRYELTNAGVSGGSPNFRLHLDGRDPVTTKSDEYTFTGVQPGAHTITVELVDANNTPVANATSEVHFTVARPGTQAEAPQFEEASLVPTENPNLPPASSALPLLSVIGFGALLGGIASALKTR